MLRKKETLPPAALAVGLLCAVSPLMIRYSQEIRNYSLLLLAAAVSFYFASRLAANLSNWMNTIGLTIGLTAAVSSHMVGIMVVSTVLFYIFISLTES